MAAVADAVVERYLQRGYRAAHPEVAAALRARLLRTDRAGYVACCHAVAEVDWLDRLARRAAADARHRRRARTPARRREMATAIAERIAGAELRVFADAAHLSVAEVGDEFHAAVASFLASLPASRLTRPGAKLPNDARASHEQSLRLPGRPRRKEGQLRQALGQRLRLHRRGRPEHRHHHRRRRASW